MSDDDLDLTAEELAELRAIEMREEAYEAETIRVCKCGHAETSHFAGWCALKARCGCRSFRSRAPSVDAEYDRIESVNERIW